MDDISEYIDYLVAEGALEIDGVFDNGEISYRYTEKMKTLCPPLWQAHLDEVSEAVLKLVDEGLVDAVWSDEENDFMYTVAQGVNVKDGYIQ